LPAEAGAGGEAVFHDAAPDGATGLTAADKAALRGFLDLL
jgi:hypothetical protein